MAALIIGNGDNVDISCIDDIKVDYVICADGGLEKAENLNLRPNLILGDFDSVDASVLEYYKSLNIEIVTDMELAVDNAVMKGFKDVVMVGATGNRLDHTLANIQLLEKYHNQGINIKIIDNNNFIRIISDNTDIKIPYKKNHFVSLVPVTEMLEGLTLMGFKYPLDNVKVQRGTAFLISNEIIKDEGRIILNKGTALVFVSKD
jgi:thiamine pyrophosphokinase